MRGNTLPPNYAGPMAWLSDAWDYGDTDVFAALIAAGEDITYLMTGQPYDPDEEGESLGLMPPLGFQPLGWGPYFNYQGTSVPVYFGDHHNYLSHADDTPANQPFAGVLETAYSVEVGIGGSETDRLAGAAISFGDIQIKNGTGDNDALVNQAWGGRAVEIKAGKEDWAYGRFTTILRGEVAALRATDERINLTLATRDRVLDNFVTRSYYAGTGGAEGPSELTGRPRPIVIGRCRNVPMLLLDLATQTWQVAEQLGSVITVRDIGLSSFTFNADYLSYASVTTASIAPGAYATCLAEGLIRFGSDVTVPTADVDGPASWGDTAPEIIEYLLKNRLGRFNLSAADIDGSSFTEALDSRGWVLGCYIDGETALRPVVDRLVRSIGGWLVPTRRGLFQIGLYARPTSTIGEIDSSIVDTAGPQLQARWRAVRKVTLGYQPMRRVLTDNEMSEAVSADDRNLLGRAFRTVEEIRSVKDRDSIDYFLDTDLDDAADAAELADLIADLLSWATHRWLVPLRTLPLRYWIGDRRTLTYPRHGLDAGASFLVVRVIETDQGDNALELWGGRP